MVELSVRIDSGNSSVKGILDFLDENPFRINMVWKKVKQKILSEKGEVCNRLSTLAAHDESRTIVSDFACRTKTT